MSATPTSDPVATPGFSAKRPEVELWYRSGMAAVASIALAKLLLHLLTASRYGLFGDELYFLACSEHLDWGYVDMPPLHAALVWFARHVLGESILAIRLLAAVAGAVMVVLAGLIARELGGGRYAMALAALATACGGVYFVMNYLMTMNAFEPVFWMGCAYVLVRMIKTGNQKLWLSVGVLAGLGLENKYSMAVFGGAIVLGLLLTPQRRLFASRWLWIAGIVGLLIFLPNIIWNVRHDWPFFELMRNIRTSGRDIALGPLQYLGQQIFLLGPVTFPVWLAGLLYFFFARDGKPYRALGWAYLVTLAFFMISKGKNYYPTPAYPMLYAAGGVAMEAALRRTTRQWLKPAIAAVLVALTIPFLPIGVPVLPVETYLRYQAMLPFAVPRSERSHLAAALPQHYAWQFGWPEMVAAVARVYYSLPPEERTKTAIIGNNYGEAGAVDFYGLRYGLPKAIAGHQNYWLWGPRQYTGEIMIVLGDTPDSLQRWCNRVEVGAELYNPYAMPFENRPVLVCRGLEGTLQQVWPRLKDWD